MSANLSAIVLVMKSSNFHNLVGYASHIQCPWMQPAYEKIGVVDAQWIRHKVVPSLGDQVQFPAPLEFDVCC